MDIRCEVCSVVVCELQPIELKPAEVNIMKRALGGFLGLDLTQLPQLDLILRPTAENITKAFHVRHIGCKNGKA